MKVTIIGAAGNVGSCAAFNIAIHRLADELVMIDSHLTDKLNQYVQDLSTAVTGLDVLVRAGSDEDMQGSNILIVAAGSAQVVASRMDVLPQNLPIIQDIAKKIKRFCPEAVVITATNPVCPLNYAMYLSTKLDRRKLIGLSINDSIRFRSMLSQVIGVKSSQVEGTVIGEHGKSQVLLFSSVRIGGKIVSVNAEIKERIQAQVANLPNILEDLRIKSGRTASWTTSMGLASICGAIGRNAMEIIPCSLVLDGEYGYHSLSMSVPAVIGSEGVQQILEWQLTPEEKLALQHSADTLKPAMQYVEKFLGLSPSEI